MGFSKRSDPGIQEAGGYRRVAQDHQTQSPRILLSRYWARGNAVRTLRAWTSYISLGLRCQLDGEQIPANWDCVPGFCFLCLAAVVGGLQEVCVQNQLFVYHSGFLSAVYSTDDIRGGWSESA